MTQPMMTTFIREDRDQSDRAKRAATGCAGSGRARRTGRRWRRRWTRRPDRGAADREAAARRRRRRGAQAEPRRARNDLPADARRRRERACRRSSWPESSTTTSFDLLEDRVPVKVRVNVQGRYFTQDTSGYNIIAEIPGHRSQAARRGRDDRRASRLVARRDRRDRQRRRRGDGARGDAHSQAVGAKPRRTIRVALWGGEEEGLYGSTRLGRAASRRATRTKSARDKLSMYLNIDPGYGPVYGFYSEGNDAAQSDLRRVARAVQGPGLPQEHRRAGIGNTDHLSFIAEGVPGFNPIQEYANYDVRIHHTNMDTMERTQAGGRQAGGDGLRDARLQRGNARRADSSHHALSDDAREGSRACRPQVRRHEPRRRRANSWRRRHHRGATRVAALRRRVGDGRGDRLARARGASRRRARSRVPRRGRAGAGAASRHHCRAASV